MKEMKIRDLIPMLNTSAEIGFDRENGHEGIGDVEVTIMDEDLNVYDIQNVQYDNLTGAIVIQFNHDND
ncbi:hypothetical protein [Streptomyces anandii]|uniref:hypothetical protein n=1 Tax=Streptomyces anandii TaxID=285454 RepID=UPI0036AFB17A